jgi:hypothetical protein
MTRINRIGQRTLICMGAVAASGNQLGNGLALLVVLPKTASAPFTPEGRGRNR